MPSLPAPSSQIRLISISREVDDYDAFDCVVEHGQRAQGTEGEDIEHFSDRRCVSAKIE
jgi:hypothetical protein